MGQLPNTLFDFRNKLGTAMQELQAFTAVVRTGSYTAAARELDVPKSTVSRRVASLEQRLGVQLLARSTRSVRVTDVGLSYFERVDRIVADLHAANLALTDQRQDPSGPLRVTAPSTLGYEHVSAIVLDYAAKHPSVQVELHLADRMVHMVEEGFDVAIRAGALPVSALKARRLGDTGPVVCASPTYLNRRGTPNTAAELVDHDCLVNGAVAWGTRWPIARGVRVSARLRSNSWEVLRQAALAGLGIALIPDIHIAHDLAEGRLVPLLGGADRAAGGLWVVYPPTRLLSPAVRTFVDHVVHAFTETPITRSPMR